MKVIIMLMPFIANAQSTFNLVNATWSNGTDASNLCTWDGTVLTVNNGASIIISGTVSNQRRIVIASNANVSITFNGVSITGLDTDQSPLLLNSGATLDLKIEGVNTLTAGYNSAGIQSPQGTKLTINGTGSLAAKGGNRGAGIGGGDGGYVGGESGGDITINGGTIVATSDGGGAGIGGASGGIGIGGVGGGGGAGGAGGHITINGGTVTATSKSSGAGIGGGEGGASSDGGGPGGIIIINGGTITATGGFYGSGIGGGGGGGGSNHGGSSGDITINGGTVMATGGNIAFGGAGIGGGSAGYGYGGSGGNITINGGTVIAVGGLEGAGIGGGSSLNYLGGSCGKIEINGGTITAIGGKMSASSIGGAGIGGGSSQYGNTAGGFSMNGNAIVFASSSDMNVGSKTGGILFLGNNATSTFYGTNVSITDDVELPSGYTLIVDVGKTFTIPSGKTLANNGTVYNCGTITNYGTWKGNEPVPFGGNTIDMSIPIPHPCGGVGWSYADNIYTIEDGANVYITGTNLNKRGITVASNAKNVNITLNNVSIEFSWGSEILCPLFLNSGATVNLTILGENTLNTGNGNGNGHAGIQVSEGATLNIGGSGRLIVTSSGSGGAGIGGGSGSSGGTITITGGTIIAAGSSGGAGIGGGSGGSGGKITITGGTVTATGGNNGAGIGGGFSGSGGIITINGGIINTTGNNQGAGIGGGSNGYISGSWVGGSGGIITINGGTIIATGGSSGGAGIGGGASNSNNSSGGEIILNGGIVVAIGETNAMGIGRGFGSGTVGTMTMNGNSIIFASSVGDADENRKIAGILFVGDNAIGKFYGTSVTITDNVEIPGGYSLTIDAGKTLTLPEGRILTNNGTVRNCGTINKLGTWIGNEPVPCVSKTVFVSAQSNKIYAGTDGTVMFPVTTTGIDNGPYSATVVNLPAGVTVQGQVAINNNAGTLTLACNTSTEAGTYNSLRLTIDNIQSEEFSLTVNSANQIKAVSVGTQNGILTAGMVSTVSFTVSTTGINNSSYPATVVNLPTGVTVQGLVAINNNSGTLTLAGNTSTKAGTYNSLRLNLDNTQSEEFILTINTTPTATIDLSDNTPAPAGIGWMYANNIYTIQNGADVTVTGTSANQRRIEVVANAISSITLNNVTIEGLGNNQSSMLLNVDANVTLTIFGENKLTAGSDRASIQTTDATLLINGTGSLTAIGGNYSQGYGGGAGIGGSGGSSLTGIGNGGTVIVNDGTIIAIGKSYGAGIGGSGNEGDGGTIIINGGNVTALGGDYGAGIGGGYHGAGGNITIRSGTITALGGSNSAGIGGGGFIGYGGSITISGGVVEATGRDFGAGIGGGGPDGFGGNIVISGGTVTATGGDFGKGIGGGINNSTGIFTMNGNAIVFASGVGDMDESRRSGGILFIGTNATGLFYGTNITITDNATIPDNYTLTIPAGKTFTIPAGIILTNNGTVYNCGKINTLGLWAGNFVQDCTMEITNAQEPIISAQPLGATYTQNTLATALSVMATVTDGGLLSYQWYNFTSDNDPSGTIINNANSNSYTPSTATVGTFYYYVEVTNTNNDVNGIKIATSKSTTAEVKVIEFIIPVNNITDFPTTATATLPLMLTGTVVPTNATNQTILWSVQSAGSTGATIIGNTLYTTAAGMVTVRATIENGISESNDYIHNFNITINDITSNLELSPAHPLKAWGNNGLLHISGLTIGESLNIYSLSGVLLFKSIATSDEMDILLQTQGAFIIIIQSGKNTIIVSV